MYLIRLPHHSQTEPIKNNKDYRYGKLRWCQQINTYQSIKLLSSKSISTIGSYIPSQQSALHAGTVITTINKSLASKDHSLCAQYR